MLVATILPRALVSYNLGQSIRQDHLAEPLITQHNL